MPGITVTAPTRVDLAGGTTDIYPLYLIMGGGCTVNAATSVYSSVTLSPLDRDLVRLASKDLGQTVEAPDAASLPVDGVLGLLCRAIKALPPPHGVEITTRNLAPAGSGLGGSSALVSALVSGLLKLRGEEFDRKRTIDLAVSVETAAIGAPTGKQDHIAAVYGGISVIEFGHNGFVRDTSGLTEEHARRLESMLILSYTGHGRFSGMNNWEITKAYIDGDKAVQDKLLRIRDIALDVGRALFDGGWDDLPSLVSQEWNIRRTLAPGVSTPRIDAMMDAAANAGALAGKVCGAGGGGCMITMIGPERRAAVEAALTAAGAQIMPFQVDTTGLVAAQSES